MSKTTKILTMKSDDNEALVYKSDRTIYFFDDVDSEAVAKAMVFLDELEKESKSKDIKFILSSPGGSIYDGFALYDRIRRSQCNVNITGTGLVASMAVIVFLAGDYRYITENCVLMCHQASDELDGRTADLEIGIQETLRIEKRTVEIISEHTRLTERQITNDIKKGDDYITPERAVSDGFAHEIAKNQRVIRRRKKKS